VALLAIGGAAAALIAVLVIGGGGGGDRGAERARREARDFTWALDPTAAPLSVREENERRGTDSWKLERGKAHGRVEGYVASQSIRPGELQRIYVRAPRARWVRVELYRTGWYGGRGARLVLASRRLGARRQPRCSHDARTGLTECRWHPTLSFRVPRALTSGVYVAKLTSDRSGERYCMFVIESPRRTPLLVQISTATYQAYNTWGGDSLYPGGRPVGVTGSGQGVEVSYDRPYATVTGAGQFFTRDVAMVRFLEREGYDAAYTTNASIELRPQQVLGRRMLLDVGHSEYWSQRAADAFRRARDAGTNLAFLASNTLAWRVRYGAATGASSERGSAGHRIVAYKEHVASDPQPRPPSGLFPRGGAPLTGTAWEQCVTPRYPAVGRSINHYYAWRPTKALAPDWLLRGTGFAPGAKVDGIVGYELDRTTPASPSGVQVVGGGQGPCQGDRPPLGVSQSTLYRAASGALVFSSGTMGWQLGLSPARDASPDAPRRADARLVRLTENLFARMLGSHANSGS
jgi:N,N-dimethylformamidase beta subunit-like protein